VIRVDITSQSVLNGDGFGGLGEPQRNVNISDMEREAEEDR